MSDHAEDTIRPPAKRRRSTVEQSQEPNDDDGNASDTESDTLSPAEEALSQFLLANNLGRDSFMKVFLSNADTELKLVRIENSSLLKKVNKLRTSHQKDNSEDFNKLKDNYQNTKTDLASTQDRLMRTIDDLKNAVGEKEAIWEKNQTLTKTIQTLMKESETVKENYKSIIDNIEEEFRNGPEKEIRELVEQNANLDENIQELEEEIMVLSGSRAENDILKGRVHSLGTEKIGWERENSHWKDQQAKWTEDRLEWERFKESQVQSINDLKKDKEKEKKVWNSQKADWERQQAEWEKDRKDWKVEKHHQVKLIENLRESKQELEIRQREDRETLEAEIKQSEALLEKAQTDEHHAQTQITEANAAVSRLSENIQELKSENNTLKTNNEQLQVEKQALHKGKEQLEVQLKDNNAEMDSKDRRIQRLETVRKTVYSICQPDKDNAEDRDLELRVSSTSKSSHTSETAVSTTNTTVDTPNSPAQQDIDEVDETATNFSPSSSMNTPGQNPAINNSTDFALQSVEEMDWDNGNLTCTDFTGSLDPIWSQVFKSAAHWKNGLYDEHMIRALLSTLGATMPVKYQHNRIEYDIYHSFGLIWLYIKHASGLMLSACLGRENCETHIEIAGKPQCFDNLALETPFKSYDDLHRRCAPILIRFARRFVEYLSSSDPIPNFRGEHLIPHLGPVTEEEEWTNFQHCRQGAMWLAARKKKDFHNPPGFLMLEFL